MPWNRPTLSEINKRIQDDLETGLPGTDPRLRKGVLNTIGKSMAGAFHWAYGFFAWLAKQVFADTADTEHLERKASIWGVTRLPPEPSKGPVTVYGAGTVSAGAVLSRSDGRLYTVDAAVEITAPSGAVQVTAKVGGVAGDCAAGTALTFQSAPPGIQADAEVAAGGLTGGADVESDEKLRIRFLLEVQKPCAGGKKVDYTRWALECAGITRAWPFPLWNGYGTAGVGFVMDDKATFPDLVYKGDFSENVIEWSKGQDATGGWTISGGKAVCDGLQGIAVDLSQDIDFLPGRQYEVTFTISDYTAGTLTPYLGSAAGTARSANGTYVEDITGAGDGVLYLRADASFAGKVDDVQVLDKTQGAEIIPGAADQRTVFDYIDEIRPVTVKEFKVIRVDTKVVDFTIELRDQYGNEISDYGAVPDVKAAIEEELSDLLYREGQPAESVSISKKLLLSRINEAISRAEGEVDHMLHVPAANVSVATDEILVMPAAITWGSP